MNVTDPLLSVAVLQIIDVFIIPVHSDAQQGGGQEAIFSQDHKVGEETCQRLDHTCREERCDQTKRDINLTSCNLLIGN